MTILVRYVNEQVTIRARFSRFPKSNAKMGKENIKELEQVTTRAADKKVRLVNDCCKTINYVQPIFQDYGMD